MNAEFWRDKWQKSEIGFHLSEVHPLLRRHGVALSGKRRVFVPLCGKSLDMLYLRELGCEVGGIELSPIAVEQFFTEHGMTPVRSQLGDLQCFEAEGIKLFQGDFFALRPEDLGEVDAVYDRAALIAMPPDMQTRYAQQLMALIPAHASILLITLGYDQSEMKGPPFSTLPEQVADLFSERFSFEEVESLDVLAGNPALQSRGLTSLTESVWRLSPM